MQESTEALQKTMIEVGSVELKNRILKMIVDKNEFNRLFKKYFSDPSEVFEMRSGEDIEHLLAKKILLVLKHCQYYLYNKDNEEDGARCNNIGAMCDYYQTKGSHITFNLSLLRSEISLLLTEDIFNKNTDEFKRQTLASLYPQEKKIEAYKQAIKETKQELIEKKPTTDLLIVTNTDLATLIYIEEGIAAYEAKKSSPDAWKAFMDTKKSKEEEKSPTRSK